MSVELRINNKRYTQWQRVQVQRSILQAAGQFTVSYSAATPNIRPDAAFDLLLDDTTALSGFIDGLTQTLSDTAHTLTAQGRDKTADLVDCSAQQHGKTGQLNGLKLDALVAALAKPYDVTVKIAPGVKLGKAFDSWSIDPGETVWSSIEKACRQRALLAISDGKGALLLTRAGNSHHPCAVVEGGNVRQASYKQDFSKRFNHYICLAQSSSATASSWSPDGAKTASGAPDVSQAKADIYDTQARPPRTLMCVNDHCASSVDLGDRVIWEYKVRRGKSLTLQVEVSGFSAKGVLWQPNQLVSVRLPTLGINDTWLIVSTQQRLDNNGETTRLELMPPDAFDLLPTPAPKQSGGAAKPWTPDAATKREAGQ